MQSVRNAFRKIYEPGTAFLLEGHENPTNLRRAIAYGGDIGGSLILAPLIAGAGASIGGALYNTAVPEPMEIPTQTLADLVSLGAMGYGGYRAFNRFNNAGGWSGLQGKFGRGESVGRETIVSPAPDASVPPPASTVAAHSSDFSAWDDPLPAPPFSGIPQPSPPPALAESIRHAIVVPSSQLQPPPPPAPTSMAPPLKRIDLPQTPPLPPPAPIFRTPPFEGIVLPQTPLPRSSPLVSPPPVPAPAPVVVPGGAATVSAQPVSPLLTAPTIPVASVEILPPDPSPPRSMKQADLNPARPPSISQEVWDMFTPEQQKEIAGI